MTMPPARIPAIPTTYNGVNFRSRLESRWAAFFDLVGWRWSYEPLDLPGRIPDFVMHFVDPTIIECKPAFSVSELAEQRRAMVRSAAGWLTVEAERELRQLDRAPYREGDLTRIDALVEHLSAVRDRGENPRTGRRALVVGSRLFSTGPGDEFISPDGECVFARCHGSDGHVALMLHTRTCIACGRDVDFARRHHDVPRDVNAWWTEAGNKVQWKPS
jgi:hypothetical protein